MNTTEMLLEFTNHCGITGVNEGIEFAKKLLEPFGKVAVSPLGSVVCTVREPEPLKPHILLDAHLDEIGFLVTRLEDNGFLRVAPFGGVDARTLAASPVVIHARTGKLNGIVCSVPPHLSTGEDKTAKPADEIFIDTGLTTEEAQEKISPGDRVSFFSIPQTLLNGNVSSKGMDDHAGCVSLIKALEFLGDDFDCGLTVMFSTMEEVGGMGAQTSAYNVNPTHALAVDVSFGDTPDTPKHKCSPLGSGVMIGHAPIISSKISGELTRLAKENDIPYTPEVMGGRTFTNSDSIATTRSGVPTGLLSIPLRYMHMPVEVVNVEDVDNTGRLIAAWVKELSAKEVAL